LHALHKAFAPLYIYPRPRGNCLLASKVVVHLPSGSAGRRTCRYVCGDTRLCPARGIPGPWLVKS
jgi:hypothetical protein